MTDARTNNLTDQAFEAQVAQLVADGQCSEPIARERAGIEQGHGGDLVVEGQPVSDPAAELRRLGARWAPL